MNARPTPILAKPPTNVELSPLRGSGVNALK